VIVTPAGTRDSRVITTDSLGDYKVAVSPPGAEYLIHIASNGYTSVDARRRAVPGDSVIQFDVALKRSAQQLPTVNVRTSRRQRPPKNDRNPDLGPGTDEQLLGSDRFGGIVAAAATIPGVTLIPGADGAAPNFSVLGLSPSQNAVTLNGLSLSAPTIPTSAFASTRFQLNQTDPTVGGFSGALVAVTLYPGGNYTFGNVSLSLDDPILQGTDPIGRAFGQRYRTVQMTANRFGPLVRDRLTYNVAAQLGRRTSDAVTLSQADPQALDEIGISRPSVERFTRTLDSLGVPSAPSEMPSFVTVDNGSFLGRLDIDPTPARTLALTGNANWRRTTPTSLGPTTLPTRGGVLEVGGGGLQVEYARYIEDFYLSRTRAGFSVSAVRGDPLTALPEGRVLTSSTLANGSSGLSTLTFGGLSAFPQHTNQWQWQATQEVSWFVPTNKHRPKLAGGVAIDGFRNDALPNSLGTFTFSSLDALAQGRPTSYVRQLSGGDWNARQSYVWGAFQDLIRLTDRFAVSFGARAEAQRIGSVPGYNASLDQALGVRTDVVPRAVALLPRAGFNWAFGRTNTKVTMSGAQPTGSVSGAIGAYRATISTSALGPVLAGTGLPDALTQIACVGPAAPTPDWAAYARDVQNVPERCAGAAGAGSFSTSAPNITAYEPGYDAPRAWRANLAIARSGLFGLRTSIAATYSLNLKQPTVTDRNFAGIPRLFLVSEENRPVFASPSEIDAATGGINPLASRLNSGFSRVINLSSDLRSQIRQVVVSVAPGGSGSFASRTWSLSYAYASVRDQARGLDGNTAGDPRDVEWGTSAGDIRHTVSGALGFTFAPSTYLSLVAQLRSGVPFTPIVQGDINGDGFSNDRAFIVDPSRSSDPAVGSAIRQLLVGSPAAVRDCLARQLGHIAIRNSCRGPWTATMAITGGASLRVLGVPRRGNVSLTINNPLGAVDQLMHGTAIRGWGQPAQPNPVLLAVTGFDTLAQRFVYAVNPLFGDTRPARNSFRAPFGLTIAVNLPLGTPYSRQQLNEVLGAGRDQKGEKLTWEQIKQRYENASFFDPISVIMRARDSLFLTRDQAIRLREIGDAYSAAKDTIWTGLAKELAAEGASYDVNAALHRVHDARRLAFDALARAAAGVRQVLTPEQLRLIAPEVQQMLDERGIRMLRDSDLDS
jgi:hypothetical protein